MTVVEPTTDETWEFDGIVLNTYAYNIATLNGRVGIPPKRGENVPIGRQVGRHFVPKVYDQRPLTLGMWVRGAAPDDTRPADKRAQFNANLHTLLQLFGGEMDRPLAVVRKVRLPSGLLTLYGEFECEKFDLEMKGDTAAAIVVDGVMPNPLWYSEPSYVMITMSGPTGGLTFPVVFPANFGGSTIVSTALAENEGTATFDDLTFMIYGPITVPRITDLDTGEYLQFDLVLGAGDFLEVHTRDRQVLFNGELDYYWSLNVGSRWLKLEPGARRFWLTGSQLDDAGTMTVMFKSAWV